MDVWGPCTVRKRTPLRQRIPALLRSISKSSEISYSESDNPTTCKCQSDLVNLPGSFKTGDGYSDLIRIFGTQKSSELSAPNQTLQSHNTTKSYFILMKYVCTQNFVCFKGTVDSICPAASVQHGCPRLCQVSQSGSLLSILTGSCPPESQAEFLPTPWPRG